MPGHGSPRPPDQADNAARQIAPLSWMGVRAAGERPVRASIAGVPPMDPGFGSKRNKIGRHPKPGSIDRFTAPTDSFAPHTNLVRGVEYGETRDGYEARRVGERWYLNQQPSTKVGGWGADPTTPAAHSVAAFNARRRGETPEIPPTKLPGMP